MKLIENKTKFIHKSMPSWGVGIFRESDGTYISVIACRKLDAANHCITLELPWLFLLALIAVLAVIYLIFTAYAKAELKKAEILPAIREE